MSHPDPRRYALSDSENERIFGTRIVPQRLAGAAGQARPVLVIVRSQTGAGKTSVTAMIKGVLRRRGAAVHISMDFCSPHHRLYESLRSADPAHADACLRPDGDRWRELALRRGAHRLA